jgi:hypothetical protein
VNGGTAVLKTEQTDVKTTVSSCDARGAKVALWWLRHYETIIHFWTGFSWVWVVGILLGALVGHLQLGHALCLILLVGVISNTGIYLSIQTLASYLKGLKDGPAKEEAHELMIKIMTRRIVNAG